MMAIFVRPSSSGMRSKFSRIARAAVATIPDCTAGWLTSIKKTYVGGCGGRIM